MKRRPYPTVSLACLWECPPGKKLPPYGKKLAEAFLLRLMPKNRECLVYLDHWVSGLRRFSVCCPPDAEPEALDWRILAGLDVIVRVREFHDADRLSRLLRELIMIRPRRLVVLRPVAPYFELVITVAGGVEAHF